MSSWRKLLWQMRGDSDPRNYKYNDAARVLRALGFQLAQSKPNGSHRVWRRPPPAGNISGALIVELVEKGHGTVKPVYIRTMIRTLDKAGLIPSDEAGDD